MRLCIISGVIFAGVLAAVIFVGAHEAPDDYACGQGHQWTGACFQNCTFFESCAKVWGGPGQKIIVPPTGCLPETCR